MFTDKNVSRSRRYQYLTVLRPILGPNETESLWCTAEVFAQLLLRVVDLGADKLRIYPASIGDKLSLVYAIQAKDSKEDFYYLLNEKSLMLLDLEMAKGFILDYQQSKLTKLNAGIRPPNGKGNTVAISFTLDALLPFRDEIICQQASGIRTYFACYLPVELHIPERYELMLHVEFALTKTDASGNDQDFHIDDCPDFLSRCGATTNNKDFNNGTLCPPCTGCAGIPEDLNPVDCEF